MKIYLVGGAVRDKLLGVKSNDLDYVMVLNSNDGLSIERGYAIMKQYMLDEGFTIFLETPECVTIRGKFPKGHKNEGITADFVLARKEIGYEEGTRRPILEIGTLFDDLQRRDFTLNALAEDEDGNIIDYFDGIKHLFLGFQGVLYTPMLATTTFLDDPLRLLRALRFCVTKGFLISEEVKKAMYNPQILIKLSQVVSQERIREEVLKMMKFDTVKTIKILTQFELLDICFGGEMWLEPTMKSKK